MNEQPAPPVLTVEDLDKMGHTLISLAKEVWVLHDRQRLMEARLGELGLDLQLDDYSPPPDLAGMLDTEREEFIKQLIDCLAGRKPDIDVTHSNDE